MNNSAPEHAAADSKVGNRRHWLLGTVAGAAALAGFTIAWRNHGTDGSSQAVEGKLWAREFSTPEGQTIKMESLRRKPLLLNFWASWCPPCIEELPLISSFYSEHSTKGFQVLGLAIDELAPVRRFLNHTPVLFPVAMAGASGIEIGRSLGNAGGGLPFTAVLNSKGQIAHRKMGRVTPYDLRLWGAVD